MPVLVSFSGLPGVGKSTIARALAEAIGAIYLRVDSIEAALKASVLAIHPAEDAGYRAAMAVARDNLALGRDVVADIVNPIALTRRAWADVAAVAKADLLDVEIVCSDKTEHRRRVETRQSDVAGLTLPTWDDVQARDYEEWAEPRLVLDSSTQSVDACVAAIRAALPRRG